MRIALLSTLMFGTTIGGVESHIRFIGKELVKRGHEIRIFKPVWLHEEKNNESIAEGMEIHYIDCGQQLLGAVRSNFSSLSYLIGFLRKTDYLRVAGKVSSEIKDWEPDVVWQHDFSSSWLATLYLSKKFPVVLTNHTGEFLLLKRLPFFRQFSPLILKHYSAIIGPSLELTPEHCTCPVSTIHNGADISWFIRLDPFSKKTLKDSLLGVDGTDKFVVFCPRRWAPTKGILFLAQAINLILESKSSDNFCFVFAGDDYDGYPGYSRDISHILENSGAQIIRLGNLDVYKMREWYQIADLVVIPSLMEAVSLAAVEAMACGAPVLSTSVGGMPELIKHRVNGYLVPPGDPHSLAESIVAISEDPCRGGVANRGFTLVQGKYSWEAIAQETENVLYSVCSGQRLKGASHGSAHLKDVS